jgi:hypothetical protein
MEQNKITHQTLFHKYQNTVWLKMEVIIKYVLGYVNYSVNAVCFNTCPLVCLYIVLVVQLIALCFMC